MKTVKPKTIFDVYTKPNKWYYLKYFLYLIYLYIKKLNWLFSRPISLVKYEQVQPLSKHPKAFDAIFFHAVSQNGIYLSGGVERRHDAKSNTVLYVVTPELGLLEAAHLPHTLINTNPSTISGLNKYSADGLTIEPIKPMEMWLISFDGVMKSALYPEREFKVRFQGSWTSKFTHFFFPVDVHSESIAKAVAREEWTIKYFKQLNLARYLHYEQMGFYSGVLTIDGKEYYLNCDAFRDHTFGFKRDWSSIHRFINHVLYLVDSTRISFTIASEPGACSLIEMGYVLLPDSTLHKIESSNLLMYQQAENGKPSSDYAFSFKANYTRFDVKIKVLFDSFYYKGEKNEAKLFERFVECSVNGVKGRGIAEWHYKNRTS